MIYKIYNNWKLYGSCHPSNIGCISQGFTQCDCKYHVTDDNVIYSFDDWQKAEDKFCEVSNAKKFVLGRTDFSGNSLT